jgi:hypothetical protein
MIRTTFSRCRRWQTLIIIPGAIAAWICIAVGAFTGSDIDGPIAALADFAW